MKYAPPVGSSDPNAKYTDPVDGTIPAAGVEQPMREIASVIQAAGLVPSETDLTQLDQAIDLKVAAVQPDLSEFVSRDELRNSGFVTREELAGFIASEKYDLTCASSTISGIRHCGPVFCRRREICWKAPQNSIRMPGPFCRRQKAKACA